MAFFTAKMSKITNPYVTFRHGVICYTHITAYFILENSREGNSEKLQMSAFLIPECPFKQNFQLSTSSIIVVLILKETLQW